MTAGHSLYSHLKYYIQIPIIVTSVNEPKVFQNKPQVIYICTIASKKKWKTAFLRDHLSVALGTVFPSRLHIRHYVAWCFQYVVFHKTVVTRGWPKRGLMVLVLCDNKYWWNQVKFSSNTVVFDRLYCITNTVLMWDNKVYPVSQSGTASYVAYFACTCGRLWVHFRFYPIRIVYVLEIPV